MKRLVGQEGMDLAYKILEALGIPKESSVGWLELKLDWSNSSDAPVTITYKCYPEPLELGADGKLISILKKCKLVEMEESDAS